MTTNLACVCVCAKSLQSCLPLWDPVDCSPPGSSVHGILQAGILGRVAVPFSRRVSCVAGGFFTTSATWEALTQCNFRSPICVGSGVWHSLTGFSAQ